MEELQKVRKIIVAWLQRPMWSPVGARHDQGQNGLRQAMAFADAAQLTAL